MKSVLDCFNIDIAKRKFLPGLGLFDRGIKLTQKLNLTYNDQINAIRQLPGIVAFDNANKNYIVNLGWAGRYRVELRPSPYAYRMEDNESLSNRNPFLGESNTICLGNMQTTYNRCWNNNNFIDCVIIINAILTCKDDSHSFSSRKWRKIQ